MPGYTLMAEKAGYIGKMPGHGDFIEGGAALRPRHRLRDWAEAGLHGGVVPDVDAFYDRFLIMPIWRFAGSPGVWGEKGVAGAICPSVDSGGRVFPLIVVAEFVGVNPVAGYADMTKWFTDLEQALLDALDPSLRAADLAERIPAPPVLNTTSSNDIDISQRSAQSALLVDQQAVPLPSAMPAACTGCWTTLGATDAPAHGIVQHGPADTALFIALSAPITSQDGKERIP